MAKINVEKQAEHLERMAGELEALIRQHDELIAQVGELPEEQVRFDAANLPDTVQAALDDAKFRAQEEGRKAVAAFKADTEEETAHAVRRARRGSIAI